MKALVLSLSVMLAMLNLAARSPVEDLLSSNTFHLGGGTAFNVRWKGQAYTVTNWHVCYELGSNELGSRRIIRKDAEHDLCILTSSSTSGIEVGSITDRQRIYTAGFPGGRSGIMEMTSGYPTSLVNTDLDYTAHVRIEDCPYAKKFVSNPKTGRDELHCVNFMELQDTDLTGSAGCSGSPVVNAEGKLVGVVNSTNHQYVSYVRSTYLVKLLGSLTSSR